MDIQTDYQGNIAMIELRRPPHNYFDVALLTQIADALESIDNNETVRCTVLVAQGKSFCAGANFGVSVGGNGVRVNTAPALYAQALRVFACRKPIVAGVQGAAIGGGLGLALAADFRVTCPEARFAANFTRLGFHPGFGLTVTLPELVGRNTAELMFYTSRRLSGTEAVAKGLANVLVEADQLKEKTIELANEIASCSPLGLLATRETVRAGLVERVRRAVERELQEQTRLRVTADFAEGVASVAQRRNANFIGR